MGGSLQCVLEHTETADYGLIFTKNLLKLTKNSLKLTKNLLKLTKNLLKLTKNLRISRNSYEYLTMNLLRIYEYHAILTNILRKTYELTNTELVSLFYAYLCRCKQ